MVLSIHSEVTKATDVLLFLRAIGRADSGQNVVGINERILALLMAELISTSAESLLLMLPSN